MKNPRLTAFAILLTSLVLQPIAGADDNDKKKKKAAAEAAAQQQLQQQQQMQINKQRDAARRAAVARAAGQPAQAPVAPPQPPVVPGPGAAQSGQVQVQVQITNLTGVPLEAFLLQPDGSGQSFGLVQPGPDPTPLQTGSGLVWVFTANGQERGRFTASAKPVQQWTIGNTGGQPRPVNSGGNTPKATGNSTPSNAQAQAFLQVHNAARSEVGVAPLRWSAEVAAYAQQWANQLAATGAFQHRPPPRIHGENIYAAQGANLTPADAARSWLSERPAFLRGQGGAGHYTQMVWRQTTEVGYGIAKGADGTVYIVANYSPPGNMMGQSPY